MLDSESQATECDCFPTSNRSIMMSAMSLEPEFVAALEAHSMEIDEADCAPTAAVRTGDVEMERTAESDSPYDLGLVCRPRPCAIACNWPRCSRRARKCWIWAAATAFPESRWRSCGSDIEVSLAESVTKRANVLGEIDWRTRACRYRSMRLGARICWKIFGSPRSWRGPSAASPNSAAGSNLIGPTSIVCC